MINAIACIAIAVISGFSGELGTAYILLGLANVCAAISLNK